VLLQTQQAFGVLKKLHRCVIMILLKDQPLHKKLLLRFSQTLDHGFVLQTFLQLNIWLLLVAEQVQLAVVVQVASELDLVSQ
jgi:hypothetical protein